MNTKNQNRTKMFNATLELLNQNTNLWNDVPAMVNMVSSLSAKIGTLSGVSAKRETPSSEGKTKSKKSAKSILVAQLLEISSVAYAYASDNKLVEKQAVFNYRLSDFNYVSDNTLISRANSVLSEAQAIITQLSNYNLSQTDIDNLKLAIAEFEKGTAQQGATASDGSADTKSEVNTINEINEIFKDKIDRMMERFKNKNKDFYNAYKSARSIKDLGTRRKPDSSANPNINTPS